MKPYHPKTGIVYYSRTGHSRRIALKLSNLLNGSLIELKAPAYTAGFLSYLRAGFDSVRQHCVLGPQSFTSLTEYDRTILCGPVWTSYPAVPLRALLRSDVDLPYTVAMFLTSGAHSPPHKAFTAGEADLTHRFAATACVANADEGNDEEAHIIKRFLRDLEDARASSYGT
ncbi:hypothetical protein [uncultured Roseobacter sp.]|uniref:flavodoxin family protein n=1 Tax=uncultured Roseobacter sp. TaxID=114847 RepID=UPI00261EC81B|nr:hypothetical protein [uncultured Roseobacter sp.]